MRKAWFLFSIGILAVAGFFRFFKLGEIPVSLYWDEIAMLVDARSLAQTGNDMHGNSFWQAIFPSYGDYKLPVYIWFASLSIKLFGASEWALRLPSALAGMGTLVLGFLLTKVLFPSFSEKREQKSLHLWLAVCVMGVIAVSPWSIVFSRTGFEGHVGQFFMGLSILAAFGQKKHWGWGGVSALLGSIATFTYFSVRFVWPIVFSAVSILFLWSSQQSWKKQFFFLFLLPLSLYWILLQPLFHSPFSAASNQFRLSTTSVLNMQNWPVVSNTYKLQAGNSVLDKITYHPYALMSRELLQNFTDTVSVDFLFLSGDPNLRHGTGQHGLFLLFFFPSFLYGWYSLFPRYWKQAVLLFVWWISALVPAIVPETTPHALRSLNALIPLSIVIGWGSFQLMLLIQKARFSQYLKTTLWGVFSVLLVSSIFEFGVFLFSQYPRVSAPSWQSGYKELATLLWQEKEGKDTVWVEPFDPRFYLWVMGYSMPVSEYSLIQFSHFMPSRLENIAFRTFDWEKMLTLEPKTIVAGKKEHIDEKLQHSPIAPTWYKTIVTPDGKTPFAVVYFEK